MNKRWKCLVFLLVLACATARADDVAYEIKAVNYKNLVAKLFLPKSQGKVPVVIAFGGSEGGLHTGNANGEMLAPHGVAVLALAYFKAEGLPPTLDAIPLEYFISAIDYLETVAAIDAQRIGVVSGSRGTEAAVLLAVHDARIKSVVLTTPSEAAWMGMSVARSAWTYKGQDVPALARGLDETAPNVQRFETALASEAAVAKTRFAFEKINGPLLLISASKDQIWPSYRMSVDIADYLVKKNFKYSVTHSSYSTGHGFSKDTAPEIKKSIIDHFLRTL